MDALEAKIPSICFVDKATTKLMIQGSGSIDKIDGNPLKL